MLSAASAVLSIRTSFVHKHHAFRRFAVIAAILCALPLLVQAEAAPVMQILGIDGEPIASGAAVSVARGADFGTRAAGSATEHVFTIRNTGDAVLNLMGSRRLGSSRFSTRFSTAGIKPGETHAFRVTFQPNASGVYNATLLIMADDLETFELHLRGTATE